MEKNILHRLSKDSLIELLTEQEKEIQFKAKDNKDLENTISKLRDEKDALRDEKQTHFNNCVAVEKREKEAQQTLNKFLEATPETKKKLVAEIKELEEQKKTIEQQFTTDLINDILTLLNEIKDERIQLEDSYYNVEVDMGDMGYQEVEADVNLEGYWEEVSAYSSDIEKMIDNLENLRDAKEEEATNETNN